MCLIKKCGENEEPMVAKSDMTVYKVAIMMYMKSAYKFMTPYQGKVFNIGDTITAKRPIEKTIGRMCIEASGVHAKLTLNDAKEYGRRFLKTSSPVIFEFVIPKGTKYYIGVDDDIAAEKMYAKQVVTYLM